MLGARAMALVRLGRFDEAAEWAVKAAARPNAHPHILAIAAYSLALAGSLDDARVQRRRAPPEGAAIRRRGLPERIPVRRPRRRAVPQGGEAPRDGVSAATQDAVRHLVAPAMAAGVTDHVRSLEGIVGLVA